MVMLSTTAVHIVLLSKSTLSRDEGLQYAAETLRSIYLITSYFGPKVTAHYTHRNADLNYLIPCSSNNSTYRFDFQNNQFTKEYG